MASSTGEPKYSGPGVLDYLNYLLGEFEVVLAASSAKRSRLSRFNSYLEGIKGEFEGLTEKIEDLQKERDGYAVKSMYFLLRRWKYLTWP